MLKKLVMGALFFILVYTRVVGLDWGLPYPMHPDERNMVNAIQQLHCKVSISNFQLSNCLNPHFFAYGQFPLYLAYGIVGVMKFFDGDLGTPIGYQEATMALRVISAVASLLNVLVILRIVEFLIFNSKFEFKSKLFKIQNLKLIKNFKFQIITLLILIFSPYFIQFSHFGTTESLLMLFYSIIIYLSLKRISSNDKRLTTDDFLLALFSGLAISTKVSSVIFLAVPIIALLLSRQVATDQGIPTRAQSRQFVAGRALAGKGLLTESVDLIIKNIKFVICIFVVFVIFSPHNIISFPDFISSINYESSVALGSYVAFYTRQFVGSVPVVFQLTKIFPYALGWPQYILAILGFFLLSWKNKYINLLRFALLVYFIPTSFMFAKWSRFMAPILPILTVFSILTFIQIVKVIQDKFLILNSKFEFNFKLIKNFKFQISNFILLILLISLLLPGFAYLSLYQNPDVRFEASQWIYQNIPAGSKILSETANVVDLPIQSPPSTFKVPPSIINPPSSNYQLASFNFYDLDENPALPVQLDQLIEAADYIIVPSRRIFANHPKEKYPILNNYYQRLFSGALGFKKVAEFSSFPRLAFQISNFKFQIPFPDEGSEETWTVFDHPVIRIYKRNSNIKTQNSNQILNLKNYQTISYQLKAKSYKLLLADSPEKWERGLMYVRNKEDIGGLDGMLFQFPDKKLRTFWNKNTISNLDLYWIDEDKIVGTSKLPAIGKSGDITTASSPEEVDRVIEVIP